MLESILRECLSRKWKFLPERTKGIDGKRALPGNDGNKNRYPAKYLSPVSSGHEIHHKKTYWIESSAFRTFTILRTSQTKSKMPVVRYTGCISKNQRLFHDTEELRRFYDVEFTEKILATSLFI